MTIHGHLESQNAIGDFKTRILSRELTRIFNLIIGVAGATKFDASRSRVRHALIATRQRNEENPYAISRDIPRISYYADRTDRARDGVWCARYSRGGKYRERSTRTTIERSGLDRLTQHARRRARGKDPDAGCKDERSCVTSASH